MVEIIKDVKIKKLKVIPDERGRLMEILRNDDDLFVQFGQVYITVVYPEVVKAWHYHKKQCDNIVVLTGMARIVLYDNRENSTTYKIVNEFFMGIHNPILLHIPTNVFHGFENIYNEEVMVLNIPSEVYNYDNPDELRIDPFNNEIPVKWNAKIGG